MMPFNPEISNDLYIKETHFYILCSFTILLQFTMYKNNDNNLYNDTSNVFAIVPHENYLEN